MTLYSCILEDRPVRRQRTRAWLSMIVYLSARPWYSQQRQTIRIEQQQIWQKIETMKYGKW